jgi:hypothetical protein
LHYQAGLGEINFNVLVKRYKLMKSFKWKRLMGLGLSFFVLSIGAVGLTGCETEGQGDAEELGEDVDEAADDLKEEAK